ncbi:hypothetical protein [Nostoc sp.]|uniref:hypothetical protein n=1 Tax=Nostoc sp. TaxID=1180 RepID=UPI002FF6A1FD
MPSPFKVRKWNKPSDRSLSLSLYNQFIAIKIDIKWLTSRVRSLFGAVPRRSPLFLEEHGKKACL